MKPRILPTGALAALLLLMAGCGDEETGPVVVSAIGGGPRLVNPNRDPIDAPAAFLLESAAQGLVRFDASGEIEPALAQRWTVSDDGLRYTFRLARAQWPDGVRVTAEQVVARLRAAGAGSSRNPAKPLLGAIDEIEAMTDEVLEISLKTPRPNFLQLLAQPALGIIRRGAGSGPYVLGPAGPNAVLLAPPKPDDEDEERDRPPSVLLRAEGSALAVARFAEGEADLVVGGTLADLALARTARPPAAALVFDPAAGLFGFAFARKDGPFAEAEARQALSMALDRAAIVAALGVPGLQPRESLVQPGIAEFPRPAAPGWAATPLAERRAAAARTLGALGKGAPLTLTLALPDGPGYRLLFALLRRDWATVGVDAKRVAAGAPADLRLVDEVALATLATWYLRHFTCQASAVCDPAADEMLEAARIAPDAGNRRALLMNADRILADAAPFIAIAAPVRWSLVSPRLTGFKANAFGHHPAGELIRPQP